MYFFSFNFQMFFSFFFSISDKQNFGNRVYALDLAAFSHYWFRERLIACLAPSRWLNQHWLIFIWQHNRRKWILSIHTVSCRATKYTWWCYQMETFSALLAICAGNSPVTGEFPAQRPVTRSFDAFFDLHPNKRFSKESWGWWFETPSRPLWRHSNAFESIVCHWDMFGQVLISSFPSNPKPFLGET